jgi:hypothetical protein
VDPTSRLPLRWGDHDSRLVAGGALVIGGALLVLQTTAYTTAFGWLGTAIHLAGWAILPARGGRRLLAACASIVALLLMLTGPALVWLVSIPVALWLLVRERPPICYLLVPLPGLAGVLVLGFFGQFVPRLPFYAFVFSVGVLTVWFASVLSDREHRRRRERTRRRLDG